MSTEAEFNVPTATNSLGDLGVPQSFEETLKYLRNHHFRKIEKIDKILKEIEKNPHLADIIQNGLDIY